MKVYPMSWTARQAGGLMLHLYDVSVFSESMLILECVFVLVNVCGWGTGRTLGLFSLPLSLPATVGL